VMKICLFNDCKLEGKLASSGERSWHSQVVFKKDEETTWGVASVLQRLYKSCGRSSPHTTSINEGAN